MCHATTIELSGCWSYSKSPQTTGGDVLTVVGCSDCLCRADVDDCSAMDFLDQSCKICVTSEDRVDDGAHDCVFGIDEANDAKVLKAFFSKEDFRLALNHGRWRCEDPLNSKAVKHCGSVLKGMRRQDYIFIFEQSVRTII